MSIRKIIFSVFILFLFFFTNAQNKALNFIHKEDLKKHLTIIASDSLMGRQIGADNNGLDMAADYIKNTIDKMGLSPVNGDYFQPVLVYSSKPDFDRTFISAQDKNGALKYKTDSVVNLSRGGNIKIENADLVFAGFGIDPKIGKDSIGNDFTGKVVMLMAGTQESFEKKEVPRWNSRSENEKLKRAKDAGAVGVILVNSIYDRGNSFYARLSRWMNGGSFGLEKPKQVDKENNFVIVTASVADAMLGGKGQLEHQLKKITKKKNSNRCKAEDVKVSISCQRQIKEIHTKNIMGVIEGSDPQLKNECVVLMAHYDHLGKDDSGDVFNGADDNGSGTVTLLGVANAWLHTPQKPKRSILFLWVTGEEVGMMGSHFYTQHPVFPLNKTVTCINIDMDGRVYEPRDSVWKDSPKKVKDFDGLYTLTDDTWPELKEINKENCEKRGLIPDYSLPSNFLRSSDHFYFHDNGVPILNLATGYHADYHKVTDEVSRINFDKMKRVADLCYLVSYEVANLDKIEIPKR